jgi:hypothetical protein
MTAAIKLTDATASQAETSIIPRAKPGGYLGFYRSDESCQWSQVYVWSTPGDYSRDYYRTPTPLSETRQEVIDAAAKLLPNGGEVKIVRIDL